MFAGTMIGVTLTFASLGGFLTPILTVPVILSKLVYNIGERASHTT